jgi:site-specific recombinase XerD
LADGLNRSRGSGYGHPVAVRERPATAWKKARAAAGYPETKFHDLRHGAASEMINAGIDLLTVGRVLGHKSVVSTKRYSHLVTDKLAAAVGRIGRKR